MFEIDGLEARIDELENRLATVEKSAVTRSRFWIYLAGVAVLFGFTVLLFVK